jgi:hypothetical protein
MRTTVPSPVPVKSAQVAGTGAYLSVHLFGIDILLVAIQSLYWHGHQATGLVRLLQSQKGDNPQVGISAQGDKLCMFRMQLRETGTRP